MTDPTFVNVLKSLDVHPVFGALYSKHDFVALNLSLKNSALKKIDVSSSGDLGVFIQKFIKTNHAKVAYGGYLERRGIYSRSHYFNQKNTKTERNIHLGIDLWSKANTPIFSPLKGIIHSFKNNTHFGDYGPTIILKHHFENVSFYTLYGHLSLESLENKTVGQKINQGQQIATLGTAKVNGDYPPHLHFQIIRDIQHYKGDYPGVSNQLDLDFYIGNCPDPSCLLQLQN